MNTISNDIFTSNLDTRNDSVSYLKFFREFIKLFKYILDNIPLKIVIFDDKKNIVYSNVDENLVKDSFPIQYYINQDHIDDDYFKINNIADVGDSRYIINNHDYGGYKILYLIKLYDREGKNKNEK